MKTVAELKRAFAVYCSEMERCETAGAYSALLHLTLVLPDICASLEAGPKTKGWAVPRSLHIAAMGLRHVGQQ